MLKGCKNYFTLYGIMLFALNSRLRKLFVQLLAQQQKSIPVTVKRTHIQLHENILKNQTYEG
jgi:hypothetical protein